MPCRRPVSFDRTPRRSRRWRSSRNLYVGNVTRLITAAVDRGIAVVMITPISNLDHRPVGVGPEAARVWEAAHATSDSEERRRLLRRARDLDAMNANIRAKSSMVEGIRGLARNGVHVLDLETALEADGGFEFDGTAFEDEVHFRQSTHERIAAVLDRFLVDRGLAPPIP